MRLQKLGWGLDVDHEADAAAGVRSQGTHHTNSATKSPKAVAKTRPLVNQRLLFGGKGKQNDKISAASQLYVDVLGNATE